MDNRPKPDDDDDPSEGKKIGTIMYSWLDGKALVKKTTMYFNVVHAELIDVV